MISALVLSCWVLDYEIFVLLYWRNARFQECENDQNARLCLLGRLNEGKKSSISSQSKRKSLQTIEIFYNSFGPRLE